MFQDFYASGISALMNNGMSPKISVNYINESSTSSWWVKLDFECEVPEINKINLSQMDQSSNQ